MICFHSPTFRLRSIHQTTLSMLNAILFARIRMWWRRCSRLFILMSLDTRPSETSLAQPRLVRLVPSHPFWWMNRTQLVQANSRWPQTQRKVKMNDDNTDKGENPNGTHRMRWSAIVDASAEKNKTNNGKLCVSWIKVMPVICLASIGLTCQLVCLWQVCRTADKLWNRLCA